MSRLLLICTMVAIIGLFFVYMIGRAYDYECWAHYEDGSSYNDCTGETRQAPD